MPRESLVPGVWIIEARVSGQSLRGTLVVP
jgi:hypothetical protein